MARYRSLRVRHAVPFAIVGAIAIGAALPSLSSAAAAPKLAQISLRQLIAKAESSHVGALEGTVRWTADLGLPDLDALGGIGGSAKGDFDWTSLVSGTHSVKVWSDGASARFALIGASSEVDLYATAANTWVYDSVTNTASHLVRPATPSGGRPAASSEAPLLPGGTAEPVASPTPQAVAEQILRNVGGITDAAFDPSQTIAGQPAYVVSFTPRAGSPGAATTTLQRLTVAVDATNGLILRASLYSRGSRGPALEVGYSSLDLLAPGHHIPASEFAFTPGPGVKVAEHSERPPSHPASARSGSGDPKLVGSGWGQVVVLHATGADLALPPSVTPPRASNRRPHLRGRTKSLGSQLDSVTTQVSGSWGSGRLLSTNLLNVLFLPNGDVVAGFATAPALEAAAASAG